MNKKTIALLLGGIFALQAGFTQAAESRVVTYVTSWIHYDNLETLSKQVPAAKADTVLLSFGKWSDDGILSFSEHALTPPAWDAYYLSSPYVNWTNLKFDHPEKKVMAAFGGQSYEDIWNYLETPEQREKVAQSLADLLSKPFPVYKKNLQPSEVVGECRLADESQSACNLSHYQHAGDVYLDGIDFDFEKASRLTEQENQNLLAMVTRLRELVGSEKLLSLTTYHVGADPENCANPEVTEHCSYIESSRSAHHGEVTQLLKDSKDVFDFFNVMTYDAGKNFRYQVAMENYANAVGDKSKVLVGATINQQWSPDGPFVETEENNLERAAWQAANGYGGFFVWTLGASTQNLPLTAQAAYVARMADAAKSASSNAAEPGNTSQPEATPEVSNAAVDLVVPDVSKAPVLEYVDYQNGGELRLYATDRDLKEHYTVRLNGKYVYELKNGKFYYSYRTQLGNGVNSFINQLKAGKFKTGDILTLHKGNNGETLQAITIGDNIRYNDDDAVKAIKVENGKVSVSLNENYFNRANRYMVYLNGKYLMETYKGKNYYSSIKKNDGLVTIYNKATIKPGDEIVVKRASGSPGVQGYVTSVIMSQKVTDTH